MNSCRFLCLLAAFLLLLPRIGANADQPKPVKVFLLAGQSNMQGQGFVKADPKRNQGKGSLEFLVKDGRTIFTMPNRTFLFLRANAKKHHRMVNGSPHWGTALGRTWPSWSASRRI